MQGTSNNKQLFSTTLIAICVLSALFSISIFRYMKSVEARYKKERVALVKEKMDLKDWNDTLKEDLKARDTSITALENEKKKMSAEISKLMQELEKVSNRQSQADEALTAENASLRKTIDGYKNTPLAQFIKDALSRETDENVRQVLSDAINKLNTIKGGGKILLEPVVINADPGESPGQGKVVSVDRRNNLMVIDLGRMHGVREGQRCAVYDGTEKIGSATVIKTRYKISAVFINYIEPRRSVKDFKEGDSIVIE